MAVSLTALSCSTIIVWHAVVVTPVKPAQTTNGTAFFFIPCLALAVQSSIFHDAAPSRCRIRIPTSSARVKLPAFTATVV